MSAQELQQIYEQFSGLIIGVGSAVVGALFSSMILSIGIRWSIFKKAGQKGWKALIPFYSDYLYYKIAWRGRIYVILLLCSLASTIAGVALGVGQQPLGLILATLCAVAVAGAKAIISLRFQFKLAHAFGRNDYFAVGLYFLGAVFTAILAFGNAKYQGASRQERQPAEQPPAAPDRRPRPVHQQPAAPQDESHMAYQQVQPMAQQRYPSQQHKPVDYSAYQQPRMEYAQQPAPRSNRRSARNDEMGEQQ